jgi:hypothetical protein
VITADDLPFLDLTWLAVDAAGHVAIFSSSGGGFIPATALPAVLAERDFEEEISHLPAFADASNLVYPDVPSFSACAERGFFVFDCENAHGGDLDRQHRYERVAQPSHPRRAASLPADLQAAASKTILHGILFAEHQQLFFAR